MQPPADPFRLMKRQPQQLGGGIGCALVGERGGFERKTDCCRDGFIAALPEQRGVALPGLVVLPQPAGRDDFAQARPQIVMTEERLLRDRSILAAKSMP